MALVEHMSVKAAACVDWPTEWRHSAASSPYTALPARARGCTPKSHSAAPTHTNSRGRAKESTASRTQTRAEAVASAQARPDWTTSTNATRLHAMDAMSAGAAPDETYLRRRRSRDAGTEQPNAQAFVPSFDGDHRQRHLHQPGASAAKSRPAAGRCLSLAHPCRDSRRSGDRVYPTDIALPSHLRPGDRWQPGHGQDLMAGLPMTACACHANLREVRSTLVWRKQPRCTDGWH